MADADPTSPDLAPRAPFDYRPIALLLLITLPWWLATTCPFLRIDDPAYVQENPFVHAGLGLDSIRWAFTDTSSGFWLPLTWLSLMLDASLLGAGPEGFHFTNILLHIANTILVYLVLHALTRSAGRSLLVAALFAMHPLRVESVAWVTERKDVLSAFFGLLALIAYTRHAQSRRWGGYILSLLFFALSLMAKPMLVTLPFLLLLLDYWPLNRFTPSQLPSPASGRRRWGVASMLLVEKLPFLLLAAATSILTANIQAAHQFLIGGSGNPLLLRLQNALVSLAFYLRDTFYFGQWSIYYPRPQQFAAWQLAAAAALLLAIAAALLIAHRKNPVHARPLIVGTLWFFGTLVPVLGLIQSGDQARADRFTYFPAIGLFIALAWVLPLAAPSAAKLRTALAIFLVAALTLATTSRLLLWRDPLAVYLTSLAHTHDNWYLDTITAVELRDRHRFADSQIHAARALALKPRDTEILTIMGTIHAQAGRIDQALPYFRDAYRLNPGDPTFQHNYKSALAALGNPPEPQVLP